MKYLPWPCNLEITFLCVARMELNLFVNAAYGTAQHRRGDLLH